MLDGLEATALAERGVVEIAGFDAEACGDVVADEFEPGALVRSEDNVLGDISLIHSMKR
jgi:hypothetical protein